MTRIITALSDVCAPYKVLYCDLWGCLHNGVSVFADAVAALQGFRAAGGTVILLTNAPRPADSVAQQLARLGVARDCWDDIATSGDSARQAMFRGAVGQNVYHIGPDKDLAFFTPPAGLADVLAINRVPLEQAEGIICTGLFDDSCETAEDYRATLLYAKQKRLKLLCANPDIVIDLGDRRLFCAGAIAALNTEMGGESLYFGKPHPPIYDLARQRLAALGMDCDPASILCIGDGLHTDIQGAMGENLDSLFVTGGLGALETGTIEHPQQDRLTSYLQKEMLSPTYAIGRLR